MDVDVVSFRVDIYLKFAALCLKCEIEMRSLHFSNVSTLSVPNGVQPYKLIITIACPVAYLLQPLSVIHYCALVTCFGS